ncbi:MAG: hypothetical protein H0T42_21965 [Deltaproteobacteria bacterium]|nr:hypothetical protein [Deltaproteobacteria bacterium]
MTTAPSAPSAPPAPIATAIQIPDKFGFSLSKPGTGGITVLTLTGTLSEEFEGRKVAESIRTKKLIVDMRRVRRLASWGMSEWVDFLRITAECDLYLVECSTYAVSQINLVTGLLGHAKLVSYYASYRCPDCTQELETLFLIPRDRDRIRSLPNSARDCPNCGGRARLEEYPAAFFDTIADRAQFDLDDEVLAHLRATYKYEISPDLTRFRALRRVQKAYTYLRLSGSVSSMPGEVLTKAVEGTTLVDLEHITFDPAQVTAWQAFVTAAMPKVSSLQLASCPPGFLETAVRPEDLTSKLKVRSFAVLYDCATCNTTTPRMVDVAENLEQLVTGMAPKGRCDTCRTQLVASLTPGQITLMRALPARQRDPALDKFLVTMRELPPDKLENALALPIKQAARPAESVPAVPLVWGLLALLIAGLAVVGLVLWKDRNAPEVVETNPTTAAIPIVDPPQRPAFTRPEWIMSDVPSSAYCHDMINRLMCVGISSYRGTRDEAVAEAGDAALEELVAAVGLKIVNPFFQNTVIPGYSAARTKAFSALQAAELDRTSDAAGVAAYAAAGDVVRQGRKRVVDNLRASGGVAVPTQRSDWYWEEYAGEAGKKETLVFVRYDVSIDSVRTLVDKYATTTTVLGSTTAMTAFPALSWQQPDFTGGAYLTKVGKPFDDVGLAEQHLVLAIGDQPLKDAPAFARLVDAAKATRELTMTVKSGDAPARQVSVRLPRR